MREVIVVEWRDSLGILHQEEVMELVRCKDCIHQFWCTIYQTHKDNLNMQNYYCADGEKQKEIDM